MEINEIVKPEQQVVSITKEIIPDEMPDLLGESFVALAAHIEATGARITGEPFVSFKDLDEHGAIHKSPIKVEVGIPIDRKVTSTTAISCYELAGYQALSTTYTGNDDDLQLVYALLVTKINEMGKTFLHKSYEYYLTDDTAASDQQVTLLEVPYQ